MTQTELQATLKAVEEAMKLANGDPKKQEQYLSAIVDPADATACDGCQ